MKGGCLSFGLHIRHVAAVDGQLFIMITTPVLFVLYLKRWIPWSGQRRRKGRESETSGKLENWLLAHWWKYQPLDTWWHKAKVRTEAKKITHLYILVYIYEIAVSMQFWSIWNWEGGERKIMMKGSTHSRRPLHTRAWRKRRRLHCGEDSVLSPHTFRTGSFLLY